MTAIFQRCSVCGYERQNAPSALPTCCNKKMVVIAEVDVGKSRRRKNNLGLKRPRFDLTPKRSRSKLPRLDAASSILRAQCSYGLPETHKLGRYDESF